MSAAYTPTTAEIRRMYLDATDGPDFAPDPAEFDRWLYAHDQHVRRSSALGSANNRYDLARVISQSTSPNYWDGDRPAVDEDSPAPALFNVPDASDFAAADAMAAHIFGTPPERGGRAMTNKELIWLLSQEPADWVISVDEDAIYLTGSGRETISILVPSDG